MLSYKRYRQKASNEEFSTCLLREYRSSLQDREEKKEIREEYLYHPSYPQELTIEYQRMP